MMLPGSVHPWEGPRAKNEPISSVIRAKAEKQYVRSSSSKMSLSLEIAAVYTGPPQSTPDPSRSQRVPHSLLVHGTQAQAEN